MRLFKNRFSKNNVFLGLVILLLMQCTLSFANIIWPGIYIVNGIITYYIIILNAIITVLFVKYMLKEQPIRIIMLISTIFMLLLTLTGLFVIPICGLLGELALSAFKFATFGIVSWIINYLCPVLLYALIDSTILKISFKLSVSKTYLKTFIYNLITIGLAVVEIMLIHSYKLTF